MKVTIDIQDDLYRRVKAKAATQGLSIRQITTELYVAWLAESLPVDPTPSAEKWLSEWARLGNEALNDTYPGPSAREILESDRNRLERR
jgi:hypothetical protein